MEWIRWVQPDGSKQNALTWMTTRALRAAATAVRLSQLWVTATLTSARPAASPVYAMSRVDTAERRPRPLRRARRVSTWIRTRVLRAAATVVRRSHLLVTATLTSARPAVSPVYAMNRADFVPQKLPHRRHCQQYHPYQLPCPRLRPLPPYQRPQVHPSRPRRRCRKRRH